MFRPAIGFVFLLAVSACANLIVLDSSTPASIQTGLKSGDRIMLTTKDDQFFQLTVKDLTDVAVEAYDDDQQLVAVPYENVARVTMRKARPGRTAAAVAGGIGVAVVTLYALAGVAAAAVLAGGI